MPFVEDFMLLNRLGILVKNQGLPWWLRSAICRNCGFLKKNLPAMRETQIWSLGWEDPLEKGMATHSSILVWRIPWTEEPGGLQSMGSQRVGDS